MALLIEATTLSKSIQNNNSEYINEFLAGPLTETARDLTWYLPIPALQQDLAIKSSEPMAMLLGRLTADVAINVLAYIGSETGVGLMIGGGATCLAGFLFTEVGEAVSCPVAAVPLVGGAALAGESALAGAGAIQGEVTVLAAMTNRGGGGWETKTTEFGDKIKVRKLSDEEVRAMGLHEIRQSGGFRGRDTFYIDMSGQTWIQGQSGGPLILFP